MVVSPPLARRFSRGTEMTDYYDALETRSPAEREAAQFAQLRAILAEAAASAPAVLERLGASPEMITDRAALAGLPVLRKSELTALQAASPPFAGLTTKPAAAFRHVFMSPGPIFEPGGDARDWWRFARCLWAAGLRAGDVMHNSFAYHLTPAGMMFENGARAIGAAVVPGGVGATEQQAQAIASIRPTGYAGTPDFLKVLLDKGAELGLDMRSITKAMVGGGALFPSLRQEYAERGVAVLQCYATADVGLIAYETADPSGAPNPGMVLDEHVILEIVRPGGTDPLPDGEVGEVVLTVLNPDYPLIRFGTGDLSAVLAEPSPCGRTAKRIKGWMGRADQRTKIKGMFVDAPQLDALLKRHGELSRARLIVSRDGAQDVFTVKCETSAPSDALSSAVAASVADLMKIRGAVELVAPGALPNDGKMIEDARDYEG